MSKQNVGYEGVTGPDGIGVRSVKHRVTYDQFTDGGGADGTLALPITIPAGSFGIGTRVDVLTAFTSASDTSTAVMNVGDGSDDDKFSFTTFNVFVAATGLMEGHDSGSGGSDAGFSLITSEATITLTITEDSDFTQITQGELEVAVYFLETNPKIMP